MEHLDQWFLNADNPANVELIVSVDKDEYPHFVNDFNWAIFHDNGMFGNVYGADRTNKIGAFNRDIDKAVTDWDILVIGQDDLQVMPHWDKIIRDAFADQNLDKAIWFDCESDDLFNHPSLPHLKGLVKGSDKFLQRFICMHPVMGRKLYERIGYVYSPIYENFFCDDEYTRVLQVNKRIHYVKQTPYLHLHPSYPGGAGEADQVYKDSARTFLKDKATFFKRKTQILNKWKN